MIPCAPKARLLYISPNTDPRTYSLLVTYPPTHITHPSGPDDSTPEVTLSGTMKYWNYWKYEALVACFIIATPLLIVDTVYPHNGQQLGSRINTGNIQQRLRYCDSMGPYKWEHNVFDASGQGHPTLRHMPACGLGVVAVLGHVRAHSSSVFLCGRR